MTDLMSSNLVVNPEKIEMVLGSPRSEKNLTLLLKVEQKVILSILKGVCRKEIISELLKGVESLFAFQNVAIMNRNREAVFVTKTAVQLPIQLLDEIVVSKGGADSRFSQPVSVYSIIIPIDSSHFLCLESLLELKTDCILDIQILLPIIENLLIPQVVESCITKDLTVPLAKIMKSAESAQQTIPSGKNSHLEEIIINATKLANSINNIVDYEKIKQDKLTLILKPVFISRIVSQVLRMIHNPSKIGIDLSIPSNMPLVKGDSGKLIQILLCLIQNAVDYSKFGGTVQIKIGAINIITTRKNKKRYSLPLPTLTKTFDARPTSLLSSASPRANNEIGLRSKKLEAGDPVSTTYNTLVGVPPTVKKRMGNDTLRSDWELRFEIKDQGVGMTQEEIKNLFTFGPKLSLIITKHLISIMGTDTLTIASKGKDQGTEAHFTIVFTECMFDVDSVRVIVVDEEADRRLEMLGILAELDIKAVVASSVKEALYCTSKLHPNIVLTTKKIDIPDAYIIYYKKNTTKEDVLVKLYEACVEVNKKGGLNIKPKEGKKNRDIISSLKQ